MTTASTDPLAALDAEIRVAWQMLLNARLALFRSPHADTIAAEELAERILNALLDRRNALTGARR